MVKHLLAWTISWIFWMISSVTWMASHSLFHEHHVFLLKFTIPFCYVLPIHNILTINRNELAIKIKKLSLLLHAKNKSQHQPCLWQDLEFTWSFWTDTVSTTLQLLRSDELCLIMLTLGNIATSPTMIKQLTLHIYFLDIPRISIFSRHWSICSNWLTPAACPMIFCFH